MDDIVKQAMRKWPNVPNCFGWLGLDKRGNWYLRDEATQAQGDFPASKGSLVEHDKLLGFIGRNYDVDSEGRWYFQNGPQRVYVELEETPWVLRVAMDGFTTTHTGEKFVPQRCLMDELGHVYLAAEKTLGIVHTQDVHEVANALEAGVWPLENVIRADLESRYGFQRHPKKSAEI